MFFLFTNSILRKRIIGCCKINTCRKRLFFNLIKSVYRFNSTTTYVCPMDKFCIHFIKQLCISLLRKFSLLRVVLLYIYAIYIYNNFLVHWNMSPKCQLCYEIDTCSKLLFSMLRRLSLILSRIQYLLRVYFILT